MKCGGLVGDGACPAWRAIEANDEFELEACGFGDDEVIFVPGAVDVLGVAPIDEVAFSCDFDVFPGHLDAYIVCAKVACEGEGAADVGGVWFVLDVEGVDAELWYVGPGDGWGGGGVGDATVDGVVKPGEASKCDQEEDREWEYAA